MRLATLFCLILLAWTANAETAKSATAIEVYTTRQPFLIEPLAKAFTAASGVKVRLVHIKLGLAERLKLEGELSPADLIITAESGDIQAIADRGLLLPLEDEQIRNSVPSDYRFRHWVALTKRVRAIITAADAPQPPTTYDDLADPALKGQICMREGRHPYNIQLVASMWTDRGEEATAVWLNGVKDNLARRPQGNDRAQIRAVAQGKCALAMANSYYVAKMLTSEVAAERAAAEKVRVILPDSVGNGSYIGLSAAGIAAHADNPTAAKQFLRFLTAAEGQELYARLNYEYPVRDGVAVPKLVAKWGRLKPNLPQASFEEVNRYRASALNLVKDVGFDY